AKGILDTKDVIYYLAFTSLALFIGLKSLEARRWKGSREALRRLGAVCGDRRARRRGLAAVRAAGAGALPLVARGRRYPAGRRVVPHARERLPLRGDASHDAVRREHRRDHSARARVDRLRGGALRSAQRAARFDREPAQQPLAADDPAPEGPEDRRQRRGFLPERSAGQTRRRRPLQAVRALLERQVHV